MSLDEFYTDEQITIELVRKIEEDLAWAEYEALP